MRSTLSEILSLSRSVLFRKYSRCQVSRSSEDHPGFDLYDI